MWADNLVIKSYLNNRAIFNLSSKVFINGKRVFTGVNNELF